jgi:hypothetical protein
LIYGYPRFSASNPGICKRLFPVKNVGFVTASFVFKDPLLRSSGNWMKNQELEVKGLDITVSLVYEDVRRRLEQNLIAESRRLTSRIPARDGSVPIVFNIEGDEGL